MKTFSLSFLLVFSHLLVFPNVPSSWKEGSLGSSVFSSRDIAILNENINIALDPVFSKAKFRIVYTLKSDASGEQIPLLFHPSGYLDSFQVWLDDIEIPLQTIPANILKARGTPFEGFTNSVRPPSREGESETVALYWSEHSGIVYNLNELKYVQVSLTPGKHSILVKHNAEAWSKRKDWDEHWFLYSLSPARFRKSFGSLEITIDSRKFKHPFDTNLGPPTKGVTDSVATWSFNNLPTEDFLKLDYINEENREIRTSIQNSWNNKRESPYSLAFLLKAVWITYWWQCTACVLFILAAVAILIHRRGKRGKN